MQSLGEGMQQAQQQGRVRQDCGATNPAAVACTCGVLRQPAVMMTWVDQQGAMPTA